MNYFNFILFLFIDYISHFCNGCIRSPTIDQAPTITIGTDVFTTTQSMCSSNRCSGSFMSTGITIVELPVDSSNCIYSIEVSCIDPTMTQITINMNGNLQVNSPSTFICNEMTSTYIFNTAMGSGSINNLQCACAPISCGAVPAGPGVVISTSTVDANCVYTVVATCTNPAHAIIYNMDISTAANSPQTLTCNNGIYQYGSSPAMDINNLECGCRANGCTGSFTSTGLTITDIPPDNNCDYYIEVVCTDPTMSIITVNNDNNIQTTGPVRFICSIDKYVTNFPTSSDFIDSLKCGCGDNTCSVNIGPGVELSTPTADGNCQYTVEARCTDPAHILRFDTFVADDPQTLNCNGNTYEYDPGDIPVNNILCECPQNACDNSLTVDPDAFVSTADVDANCVYTVEASCNNIGESLIYNSDTIDPQNSPQTLTCDPVTGLYTYPPNSILVFTVDCDCTNPCDNSYTEVGTGITVSNPYVFSQCMFAIDVSCADPADPVVINQATDNSVENNPSTFLCDATTMKYYNNRIDQVNIDTIQCGCGANPCTLFTTGAGVDLTTPTADGNCVYSLVASCANPAFFLIFNNDNSIARQNPETLTCSMGAYQYDFFFASGTVNNIDCTCRGNPCTTGFSADPSVVVSPETFDNNCVYTIDVSCPIAGQLLIFNFPGTSTTSPQTLTCTMTGPGLYNYQTPAIAQSAGSVRCECPANSCAGSFLALGPEITVTTDNTNCDYPAEITCSDPTYDIIVNFQTDRIRISPPQTFTCDSTVMKYTYNTISINTLQCVPPCTNPCTNLGAGMGITLSAPVADGNCIYTITATCTFGTTITVDLIAGTQVMAASPQDFTCDTGPNWLYNDGVNPPQEVSALLMCS